MVQSLRGFLADTWWFGLTHRLTPDEFAALAKLRSDQGFTAIQLVAGIPPEVGPTHPNARSHSGFPWTLNGSFNAGYLRYAQERIALLNELGLTAIVYGAWGHQIDWLGPDRMGDWWSHLVDALDNLDVVYCLTGEINLWLGRSAQLLPDKSTDDLVRIRPPRFLMGRLQRIAARLPGRSMAEKRQERREKWDAVLGRLAAQTRRPIIVHPTAYETGYESVQRPELLSANTAQTGHSHANRDRIWQLPLELLAEDKATIYINLEPWYEGIRDNFWTEDQLFAYWASMLGGAASHCYGAHGIWNVGDGHFLAHWGGQTYEAAKRLDTPRLLGLSHRFLLDWRAAQSGFTSGVEQRDGELISVFSRGADSSIHYYPDIFRATDVPHGTVWLPTQGSFANSLPQAGQVVVVAK